MNTFNKRLLRWLKSNSGLVRRWIQLREEKQIELCLEKAKQITAAVKSKYPHCEGVMAMAWPTTGAGSVASGYIATGTATTLLWGTKDWTSITGFLTVNSIKQSEVLAFDEKLPNGDGLTAGTILGVDGNELEIEVRDDTNQNCTALRVGAIIQFRDGAGMLGARTGGTGANYNWEVFGHDWSTAPKTPAGRTLKVRKFALITL